MSSITSLYICNLALKQLNANTINSMDENSNEAKFCSNFYEQSLRSVLEAYPWQSVVKRVELARLTTTPVYDWDYEFSLPADFLRLLETCPETDHQIEGDKLLCNVSSIYIRYIRYTTDVSEFSPRLVDTIALDLASRLAFPLSASSEIVNWFEQRRNLAITQAKNLDARQQRHATRNAARRINQSRWNQGRR